MSRIEFPVSPSEDTLVNLPNNAVRVFQGGAYRMVKHTVTGPAIQLKFDRYDLAVATTTGVLDVAVAQTFKLANNTNSIKNVSVVNAPANRSMAIVLQIAGNVGTVIFPETFDFNLSALNHLADCVFYGIFDQRLNNQWRNHNML